MTMTTGTVAAPASAGPVSIEALEADYAARNPRSRQQYELGRTVMPGGGGKGGVLQQAVSAVPGLRREGCYVTTLDGQRLLDCANHHTAGVLGHRHPAVMAAVQEQLAQGLRVGWTDDGGVRLGAGDDPARAVAGARAVYRLRRRGGAERVAAGARVWTGRQKIAKFEGAFHGRVDALEVSVSPPLDQAGTQSAPQAVPAGAGVRAGGQRRIR